MYRFWMIWNEGNRAPTIKHPDEESARIEAERLVRLNPGQKFYLLVAIDCCQKYDVQWQGDSEVPF